MKRNLCFLYVMLLLVACTEKYQALQRIEGPADCMESVGCSWNDGVVSFTAWSNENSNHFTFLVKEEGELIFYYKLEAWKYQGYNQKGWLTIKLNDTSVFNESGVMSSYKKVSLGKVAKGNMIKMFGNKSYIKDIMIVGDINEGDSSQWDF